MSRISRSLILSLVIVLAVLPACGTTGPTPTPEKIVVKETVVVKETAAPAPTRDMTPVYDFDENVVPNRRYKLALVVKSFESPFWLVHEKWAKKAGEDYGVDVTVLAPSKGNNVEEQIRIVEDLIQTGIDGVAIAPANSVAIAAATQKLNEAGIPVVWDNTRGSGGDYVCYIGADNILVGHTLSQALVERMGTSGQVLILEGFPGQQTADDRRKGMNDELTLYPDIQVASQTTHWQRLEGMQVTENTLQRWPDLVGVIGASVEPVLGGIEALKAAGIDQDKIWVGGVDVYADAVQALESGWLDFTLSQNPQKQAYWSIVALIKALNGEEVPAEIRTPVTVLDLNTPNWEDYKE
jgi:ribose transport system substrate-binding protein